MPKLCLAMGGLGLWVTLASPAPGLLVLHVTDCVSFCFVLKKNELLGWDLPPLQGFGH